MSVKIKNPRKIGDCKIHGKSVDAVSIQIDNEPSFLICKKCFDEICPRLNGFN
jgi:hypothetical protein